MVDPTGHWPDWLNFAIDWVTSKLDEIQAANEEQEIETALMMAQWGVKPGDPNYEEELMNQTLKLKETNENALNFAIGCVGGPEMKVTSLIKNDLTKVAIKNETKIATSGNYRKLYLKEYPELPSGWHVHHTLPQKYAEIMEKSGININKVKYLKGVDPKIHERITVEWVKWGKSLGHTPTAEEIISFSEKIDNKYSKYWFNK